MTGPQFSPDVMAWSSAGVLLGLGDQVVKGPEEVICVIRAGGGLGVILDGEYGQLLEAHAGNGLVVKVEFGDDGTH